MVYFVVHFSTYTFKLPTKRRKTQYIFTITVHFSIPILRLTTCGHFAAKQTGPKTGNMIENQGIMP